MISLVWWLVFGVFFVGFLVGLLFAYDLMHRD
jgi:hypothetical protein